LFSRIQDKSQFVAVYDDLSSYCYQRVGEWTIKD
jgi:hypothetical protein